VLAPLARLEHEVVVAADLANHRRVREHDRVRPLLRPTETQVR
jgi:hypothetical protein